MAFDPSTAKISSFDPSTAKLADTESQGSNLLEKGAEYVSAAGGGVAKALANVPQATSDIITYTLDKLNIISPETAKKLYAASQKSTDILRPQKGSITKQAMEEHPYVAKGAEIATNVGALGAGMKAVGGLGKLASTAAPAVSGTAGVLGRAVGSGLLNTGIVDEPNKNTAFTLGAAISPAADLIGMGIKGLGTRYSATQQIDDIIQKVDKNAVNKAYTAIRTMPFNEADSTITKSLANNIDDLVSNADILKSSKQTRLLKNLSTRLNNAKSHSDILDTIMSMGKQSRFFKGLEASDELYSSYSTIKASLEEAVNTAATRNSLAGALNAASNLSKQNKTTTAIFKSLDDNPSKFNFKAASKKLAGYINEYKDVEALKPTVDMLTGLKKLTDSVAKSYSPGALTVAGTGAGIGYGAGYQYTDSPIGAGVGAALGAIAGPSLIFKLTNSAQGQNFLRSLADPGIKMQAVNDITRALGLLGTDKAFNINEK